MSSDASGYESAPAIAGDLELKECTMAEYERDDAEEIREKADDLGGRREAWRRRCEGGASSLTDRPRTLSKT